MSSEWTAFWTLLATIAGILVAAAGVLVALVVGVATAVVTILPWLRQEWDKRLLMERVGRGPYDQATIESATRYYVRPKCSNIDPAQEKDMRHALVATREDMFAVVDRFLDGEEYGRHLLVLADSGTGKTSFMLNYYVHNARRRKPHRITLVPLGVKDADELINAVGDQKEGVIFLDALDEDTKAIQDHRQRVRDLMDKCQRFRRVVITCRTQFFPSDEEIPVETGLARIGPRKAGEGGHFEFRKIYLSPFDDKDVATYLKLRFPWWRRSERKRAFAVARKIPSLTVRPMLLAHIPDVLAHSAEVTKTHELYEAMVVAWVSRETGWVDKNALRRFSELLAVDVFVNREARGAEHVPHAELVGLAERWGIPLQPWQVGGRSLLNRDAVGNYKFAHRSIAEYLFVRRLILGDAATGEQRLTDLMKELLFEIMELTAEQRALVQLYDERFDAARDSGCYKGALIGLVGGDNKDGQADESPGRLYDLDGWPEAFVRIAHALLVSSGADELGPTPTWRTTEGIAVSVQHLARDWHRPTPMVEATIRRVWDNAAIRVRFRKVADRYVVDQWQLDDLSEVAYRKARDRNYYVDPRRQDAIEQLACFSGDDRDKCVEMTIELMRIAGAGLFDAIYYWSHAPGLVRPYGQAKPSTRLIWVIVPPPIRQLLDILREAEAKVVAFGIWTLRRSASDVYSLGRDFSGYFGALGVPHLHIQPAFDRYEFSQRSPLGADALTREDVMQMAASHVVTRVERAIEWGHLREALNESGSASSLQNLRPTGVGSVVAFAIKADLDNPQARQFPGNSFGVLDVAVIGAGGVGRWEQVAQKVASELGPYLSEYYTQRPL